MTMAVFDWQHHITAFRASGKTVRQYCSDVGLKPDRFKYHLYKQSSKARRDHRFAEFAVESALVISRDDRGSLSISGVDVSMISRIIGAWNDALS